MIEDTNWQGTGAQLAGNWRSTGRELALNRQGRIRQKPHLSGYPCALAGLSDYQRNLSDYRRGGILNLDLRYIVKL